MVWGRDPLGEKEIIHSGLSVSFYVLLTCLKAKHGCDRKKGGGVRLVAILLLRVGLKGNKSERLNMPHVGS